jgi:GNAT superfamily N-acetyltransferase
MSVPMAPLVAPPSPPSPRRRPPSVMPAVLRHHLRLWVGGLPAPASSGSSEVRVVPHAADGRPGWDGARPLLTGLVDPCGNALVAVPTGQAARVTDLLRHRMDGDWVAGLTDLPALLGRPRHTVERVAFRWSTAPADLPAVGVWVPTASPALPAWLRPFGDKALVAFDEDGRYLAGVGLKRHDSIGREISVGTEPHARGRGLARCLVAQAARHVLADGRIPTYLHTFDNAASSRVASAAGFGDLGWSALMLSDEPVAAAAGTAA